jgi:N-methylhydantoinase A
MIRVAVDVGGTFTDLVAVDESGGNVYVVKVRSTPKSPERGFLEAVSNLIQLGVKAEDIGVVVHVGTIGTNLFLGQLGLEIPRIALVTTKGFRDVVEIGRQNRPQLYNIFFQRPKPIVPRELRFEVDERTDADGRVLARPGEDTLRDLAGTIKRLSPTALAVCFLNSYVNPSNERLVKEFLERETGLPAFASYEVDREHREYERMSTTAVNTALAPIISRYMRSAKMGLEELGIAASIYVMSSAGGLVDISEVELRPIVAIESGPAAGVVGAANLARLLSLPGVISLDMGGTTAKAGTIIGGAPLVVPEMVVGGEVHMGRVLGGSGYPVRTPTIDLAEVSAGGGTVVRVDAAGSIRVGPLSAGAYPGPACYGLGGEEATVTDANLVLGRLGELLAGGIRLDRELAKSAMGRVASAAGMELEDAAWTAITLANLQMAKAVNLVSVERGLDPRDFTLVAFGGAGPMHAAELAEHIGMKTVVIPPYPGLFSAMGLLTADMVYPYVRGYITPLNNSTAPEVENLFQEMESKALKMLAAKNMDVERVVIERSLDMRYLGQGYELEVRVEKPFNLDHALAGFERRHEGVYGYLHRGADVELTALRIYVRIPVRRLDLRILERPYEDDGMRGLREAWFKDGWAETPIVGRAYFKRDRSLEGPLIVEEADTTIVIPPGWSVRRIEAACLLLRRMG